MFDFGRKTMAWEEFTKTAEYLALNGNQRSFVQAYLESGDATFAFQQAYSATSPEVARTGSYAILRRKVVKAAIQRFMAKSMEELQSEARELLVRDLDRERRSKSKVPLASRLRCLELKAQLLGITLPAASFSEETPALAEFNPDGKYRPGDHTKFQGRKIVITAVDPKTSRATDYEWVEVK